MNHHKYIVAYKLVITDRDRYYLEIPKNEFEGTNQLGGENFQARSTPFLNSWSKPVCTSTCFDANATSFIHSCIITYVIGRPSSIDNIWDWVTIIAFYNFIPFKFEASVVIKYVSKCYFVCLLYMFRSVRI